MKTVLVLVGFLGGVFCFSVRPAWAQELKIRALLANPADAEETEWIAIENTSSASVSANGYFLRDTQGSVKQYALSGSLSPGEIWVLPRTQTGITLNNDTEGAELLRNGSIVDFSPSLTNPGNDQVWIVLAGVWRFISLAEWVSRLEKKEWNVTPSPSPSPVPSSSPSPLSDSPGSITLTLLSPCTSPEWIEVRASKAGRVSEIRVEDSSGTILKMEDLEFSVHETRKLEWAGAKLSNTGEWVRVIFPEKEEFISYPACKGTLPFRFHEGKWQQSETFPLEESENLTATPSAEKDSTPLVDTTTHSPHSSFGDSKLLERESVRNTPANPVFPVPSLPDFSQEEAEFARWKDRSLFGSFALIFAGVNALALSFPHLWYCYNEYRDPW